MAAIASLSDLVNRMTGGNNGSPENIFCYKEFTYSGGTPDSWTAGAAYSAWRYDGYPSAGSTPTSVEAPTKATTGAIPFTNPGGGREKWLVQATAVLASTQSLMAILLYDRLLHIGGLDGTVATAQTVGGTLTRNTGGAGNIIFAEIYTQVGTTPRNLTVSYTNQGGTSSRTTQAVAIGGTAGSADNDTNAMLILPLQAGDSGVQAVASATLSASTGTAGNFGITVARPIAWIVPGGRGAVVNDFTVGPGGMPEIDTDACLALMYVSASATESGTYVSLSTVEA